MFDIDYNTYIKNKEKELNKIYGLELYNGYKDEYKIDKDDGIYYIYVKNNGKWDFVYKETWVDEIKVELPFTSKEIAKDVLNKIKNNEIAFLRKGIIFSSFTDG